ncbi:hypothetical protein ACET6V_14030 [Aeromonas caviae]|uniref:hypothetical protein n=1 Tax=Aeromonas caviae TaxID=648 RepID=UPI0038D0C6E9
MKIMKTGCQQIAKGFAGETVPLDEADPQGAGVLRNQVVEGFVLLMLDYQGEIVNILLKIKNSFLPTKQILIGL